MAGQQRFQLHCATLSTQPCALAAVYIANASYYPETNSRLLCARRFKRARVYRMERRYGTIYETLSLKRTSRVAANPGLAINTRTTGHLIRLTCDLCENRKNRLLSVSPGTRCSSRVELIPEIIPNTRCFQIRNNYGIRSPNDWFQFFCVNSR